MHRFVALFIFVLFIVPVAAQDTPPGLDPANLTATIAARLPLLSAPAKTSAHLSPSGTWLLHARGTEFCLYELPDTLRDCVDARDQWGDNAPSPDAETFRWSPDERYVAFTEPALVFFRDSDVWVFDTKMGQFMNLTNDRYEGRLAFSPDDVQEGVYVDLAPAWHPDGRLTFARYDMGFQQAPQLTAITLPNGDPELLTELPVIPGSRSFVMDMDWAPDGSFLAYAIDLIDSPLSGVWGYFVDDDEAKLLATPNQQRLTYVSLSVSPDSQSILALTPVRDQVLGVMATSPVEDNGYAVISVENATRRDLAPGRIVLSAGWLPDGGLLIVESWDPPDFGSNLLALVEPSDEGALLMDSTVLETDESRFFSPTSIQKKPLIVGANGVVVLATVREETLVVQLESAD